MGEGSNAPIVASVSGTISAQGPLPTISPSIITVAVVKTSRPTAEPVWHSVNDSLSSMTSMIGGTPHTGASMTLSPRVVDSSIVATGRSARAFSSVRSRRTRLSGSRLNPRGCPEAAVKAGAAGGGGSLGRLRAVRRLANRTAGIENVASGASTSVGEKP